MELKHNKRADIDVANMGMWGVHFQDDPMPETWHADSGATGVLAYIDYFSENINADTPIFWETWRDKALAEAQWYPSLQLNWYRDPLTLDFELDPNQNHDWYLNHRLADWELELLTDSIAVETAIAGNYSTYIRHLVTG